MTTRAPGRFCARRFLFFCLCALALPGTMPGALAQDVPLVATELYTIEPCRAVDTREEPASPLLPGQTRLMEVAGCGVPLSAYSVVLNITVVDAVGSVVLQAFPGDQLAGAAQVVAANPANPTRSALAVVPLATDGSGTIGITGTFTGGFAQQAHVVLDVTGFFAVDTPSTLEDPGGDDLSTLGEIPMEYDGDPSLLDFPEHYAPDELGKEPGTGYNPSSLGLAAMDCSSTTAATNSITPIGLWGNSSRYLSYGGAIKLLVGVSGDTACHFLPTAGNGQQQDKCHLGNYTTVLTDLENAGFNHTQVWVALGEEVDAENIPFKREGNYWRLDQPNTDYFNRIREVVSKAKELNMFVEVVFFAPFEGPEGQFVRGPWSWKGNKARAPDVPNGPLKRVGFTQLEFSVVRDTRTVAGSTTPTTDAARNERMREFQKNVIQWTVEALWCYDNVIWLIANEPENREVNPLFIAEWHRNMIDKLVKLDDPADAVSLPDHPTPRPPLTRAHLIAVQPLSQKLADELLATEPRFSILTGHYTQVENSPKVTFPKPPGSPEKIDLGAIQMARRYASQAKPVGFIEGKISPYSGIPEGPRSHVNGVLAGGGPYSARAEAWEFFFYRGAILDHWGYLTSGGNIHPTVAAIRQQLAALKTFMSGLPLARLKTSAIDTTTGRPLWIVGGDLGPYPDEEEPWDAERSSQRFFGALQTNENDATGRWFLLYMHHSTRRCYAPPKAAEPDFTAAGCDDDDNPGTAAAPPGNYMVLGGYDARLWTTPQSKRYRETLHVNLGPNPGTFDVLWIKPENLQVVKQQAVAWKQSSCSLPGCVVCSNPTTGNPCSIGLSATEGYDYDIALKIVQR